jgi:hypothetical protein
MAACYFTVFCLDLTDSALPLFFRALESKSFRRPNRFDVEIDDGSTCAFSAPSETEMEQWLKVIFSRVPSPTHATCFEWLSLTLVVTQLPNR